MGRFFESTARNLPLYLLSWPRNIIYDHKNGFLKILENIINFTSQDFHESEFSRQYCQIPSIMLVSIENPIISACTGHRADFRTIRENPVM